jgi:hypothetical protein
MLLSIEELKELSGCKQKRKIKEWLQRQGINYINSADGHPKVSKEAVQEMLKGNIRSEHPRRRGNADALKALMGG